jgi:hypothetical protein
MYVAIIRDSEDTARIKANNNPTCGTRIQLSNSVCLVCKRPRVWFPTTHTHTHTKPHTSLPTRSSILVQKTDSKQISKIYGILYCDICMEKYKTMCMPCLNFYSNISTVETSLKQLGHLNMLLYDTVTFLDLILVKILIIIDVGRVQHQ